MLGAPAICFYYLKTLRNLDPESRREVFQLSVDKLAGIEAPELPCRSPLPHNRQK